MEALESLRGQVQDRGSSTSSSTSSRFVNRHGHNSRSGCTTFQQLRQKMTDVMQQLRQEMNETVSGRIDMLSSINTALQKVSAKPIVSKPYRINDLIPGNWGRQQRRRIISTLHVGPAHVDASVVRRRRNNACHRAEHRQVRQQHACSGLFR